MQQTIKINDRIELTEVRDTDKAALVQHLNDLTIFENTLMIPYPYTEASAEWFINYAREMDAEHGFVVEFAIRTEGVQIGGIGLMLNNSGNKKHKAEIGYWIAKTYRGQGIITEVLINLVEHVFNTTHLVRLEATVFEPNLASQKALEKAGFEREGFVKKYIVKPEDGIPRDIVLYGKVKI
jgi:[ribosomal protein S5]-alanine N-acetyltransferase